MHEKTFAAINKLKDIELELHRLKNALEMANRALDAQRPWVGLTDDEMVQIGVATGLERAAVEMISYKLKEKNT